MIHPFIDTSKMTDEEIVTKQQELYRYLQHQEYMGHAGMYDQILTVIKSLEMEQHKRMSDALIQEQLKNQKDLEFGDVTDELGIDYNNDEQSDT